MVNYNLIISVIPSYLEHRTLLSMNYEGRSESSVDKTCDSKKIYKIMTRPNDSANAV